MVAMLQFPSTLLTFINLHNILFKNIWKRKQNTGQYLAWFINQRLKVKINSFEAILNSSISRLIGLGKAALRILFKVMKDTVYVCKRLNAQGIIFSFFFIYLPMFHLQLLLNYRICVQSKKIIKKAVYTSCKCTQ